MKPWILPCLLLSLTAGSALAGFEWVPPANNPTAPEYRVPGPNAPDLPADVVRSIQSQERQMNLAPAQPRATPLNEAPRHTDSAPQAQQPRQGSVIQSPSSAPQQDHTLFSEGVQGFGDGLPLAIALQEVVPPQFSYAFASGSYAGLPVSWNGQGRAWPEVVSEMLLPHGLMASFRGRALMISKAPSQSSVMSQPNYQPQSPQQPTAPSVSYNSSSEGMSYNNGAKSQPSQAAAPVLRAPAVEPIDMMAYPDAQHNQQGQYGQQGQLKMLTPDDVTTTPRRNHVRPKAEPDAGPVSLVPMPDEF